jgi:hypothetical protein
MRTWRRIGRRRAEEYCEILGKGAKARQTRRTQRCAEEELVWLVAWVGETLAVGVMRGPVRAEFGASLAGSERLAKPSKYNLPKIHLNNCKN